MIEAATQRETAEDEAIERFNDAMSAAVTLPERIRATRILANQIADADRALAFHDAWMEQHNSAAREARA